MAQDSNRNSDNADSTKSEGQQPETASMKSNTSSGGFSNDRENAAQAGQKGGQSSQSDSWKDDIDQ